MKAALDTNVLAYAEGVSGVEQREAALDLLRNVPQEAIVIPVQALGELFAVLVRKAGKSRSDARAALLSWRDAFSIVETSSQTMQMAADLATDHRLAIWDAVILSSASLGECRLLLSEDLQEGFLWGGVTVVNPFTPIRHSLLDALLK